MYLGAFDMLSMPPATTTSLMPNWILCAASIVAAVQNKYIMLLGLMFRIIIVVVHVIMEVPLLH